MKSTRYEQVADRILNLIRTGALKPGDRIPSLRQLSRELNVSVNTVKAAYFLLEDRNHITAVPQSGFYVSRNPQGGAKGTMPDFSLLDPMEVNPCRLYGAFQEQGRLSKGMNLGLAALDPHFWPAEKLTRYFADAAHQHSMEALDYIMPPGYTPLREQLARHGMSAGQSLSPDDFIITNGCHEAVFLALMATCKPGDTVAVESPIYFNLLKLFQLLELKVIELPATPEKGMSLEALRFVLDNFPVRAMFSIPNFNNPMGYVMPLGRKKMLLRMLQKAGIPLIEDDIYGDLSFGPRPETVKSLDTEGNVLLCSSFSKTLSPGLRVGWIAPGQYYEKVMRLKILVNIATAGMNQVVAARYLKEGGYERHLRKLRGHLKENMAAFRTCLLDAFPKGTQVSNPNGGLLLWVELPGNIDVDNVYRLALKQGLLITPGSLFSLSGKFTDCIRLNVGVWDRRMEVSLRLLGRICNEQLENGDAPETAPDFQEFLESR